MRITEIARLLFMNSVRVSFGSRSSWDRNMFLSNWNKAQEPPIPNLPGLYWIGTDSDFTDQVPPQNFPRKGCNFRETSQMNLGMFSPFHNTKITERNFRIVYNGHEKNVIGRLRSHFSLSNNETGALGIRHYEISGNNWLIYYFTTRELESLNLITEHEERIRTLLNNRIGRGAIESAWRAHYGWPELCKL